MKGEFKKASQLIFQIITVIVLFTVAIYGLWRINLIRLPSFIENIINTEESDGKGLVSDGYEIFKHIQNSEGNEFDSIYPVIETSNLKYLLDSVKTYDHFYWESRSEIISSESKRVFDCKSRISQKKYNIEILNEQGNTVRKCVSDGEKTVISSQGANGFITKEYNRGLNDFYSDSYIVSIDYFKNFDFSSYNSEVRQVNIDGYNLVSITYSYNRNGVAVKNNFLVSLDFGVVLFGECRENDVIVYTLNTNSIYPLPSLDSDIFAIS